LGSRYPIMEEWNAWLKDWGKLLRENLAASGCGPVDAEIQRLLGELEKKGNARRSSHTQ
jgi:hypothetical protein